MKKISAWVIGAVVITILAAGAFGATTAFADDDGPEHPFSDRDGAREPGSRGFDSATLEAIAEALDMSADDLSAAQR